MSIENKKYFLARYGTLNHLDELINDQAPSIRWRVFSNPLIKQVHIDKLLHDDDEQVRAGARIANIKRKYSKL